LQSMVTMLKSKWRCVVKVLQVNPPKNALQIFSGLCIFTFRISFVERFVKDIFTSRANLRQAFVSDLSVTWLRHKIKWNVYL
jgi:hypothetical protein